MFYQHKGFKSWHLSNSELRLSCEWVTGVLRFDSQPRELKLSIRLVGCVSGHERELQLQVVDALPSFIMLWGGSVTIFAPLGIPGSLPGTHLRAVEFTGVCIFF